MSESTTSTCFFITYQGSMLLKIINSLHIYFIIQVFKYIVNKSILDFLESTLLHHELARDWSVHACVIYVLKCYILFLFHTCYWFYVHGIFLHSPAIHPIIAISDWNLKKKKKNCGIISIIYIAATVLISKKVIRWLMNPKKFHIFNISKCFNSNKS